MKNRGGERTPFDSLYEEHGNLLNSAEESLPEDKASSPDTPPDRQDGSGGADVEHEVWIYPPHNSEGISYTYQFRGVPQLEHWMDEVVYSRRFPYRNKRDIMRHALHRHMVWLQSHPGCPHAPSTVQIEMMRVLESEDYEQMFAHMMRKMEKLVSKALAEATLPPPNDWRSGYGSLSARSRLALGANTT